VLHIVVVGILVVERIRLVEGIVGSLAGGNLVEGILVVGILVEERIRLVVGIVGSLVEGILVVGILLVERNLVEERIHLVVGILVVHIRLVERNLVVGIVRTFYILI
jgi:hypothetical protein